LKTPLNRTGNLIIEQMELEKYLILFN